MEAVSAFKAYDIRGIVGQDITTDFSRRLGRAIVEFTQATSIAVGRDIRSSGESLKVALIQGIVESGCTVFDLGVVPTGVVYRSTVDLDVDSAIAITASHNPPEYNGFKIVHEGLPVAGEDLQRLKAVFDSPGQGKANSSGAIISKSEYHHSVIDAIVQDVGPLARRVKVAVDSANAVPGPFMVELCDKLGVDLVELNCSWDHGSPAHPADPTRPENMTQLSDLVASSDCEFGIGVDGDGDRIGVVDENGDFIHPDRLIGIFANDVLADRKGASSEEGRTILFDVKCSMGIQQAIEASGGIPKMVRTGHSFMKRELSESPDIMFAGEMSGHLFFNDRWNGHDCSMYNSARLIELVARRVASTHGFENFSDLISIVPSFPATGENKIPYSGDRMAIMMLVEEAFSDMECLKIDGVRVVYPDGWFLCRPSNTEPVLIMRAEAHTNQSLRALLSDVVSRMIGVVDVSELN
ncbi:MAG: phosphomannomutase/phosphoglucomutase [Candidatus Thermoplasmatota archaeon]|nr:phosphomannomutase/phosphoglucomutase [Candidatus Thermoplasmatota archaeon]